MSYSIMVDGQKQTIEEIHNKGYFTEAVEMFRLFDDSRINLEESRKALKKMSYDLKCVRFYYSGSHECIFNSYMFACFLGNYKLILELAEDNGDYNLYPNDQYTYGTHEYITPFAAICQGFNPKTGNNKEALDLFLRYSDYDINQVDIFGERSIPQDAIDYIQEKNSFIKNISNFEITIDKFYLKGTNQDQFKEYSDLDSNVKDQYISYTLNLQIRDHKFKIPFYFDDCYDSKMVKSFTEFPQDKYKELYQDINSGIVKLTDEEKEILKSERKLPDRLTSGLNNFWTFKKTPNGKKIVRFFIDDNSYEIEEFTKLDEFKMGPDISVNKEGLIYDYESIQNISLKFELKEIDLSSKIIHSIISIYNQEKEYFNNKST